VIPARTSPDTTAHALYITLIHTRTHTRHHVYDSDRSSADAALSSACSCGRSFERKRGGSRASDPPNNSCFPCTFPCTFNPKASGKRWCNDWHGSCPLRWWAGPKAVLGSSCSHACGGSSPSGLAAMLAAAPVHQVLQPCLRRLSSYSSPSGSGTRTCP
jgi:hypothetical protein